MLVPDLDVAEKEILCAFPDPKALDPFGMQRNSNHTWDVAKAVDQLFTRKTVRKGGNLSAQGMFYCVDCDSFVKCAHNSHDLYVRCMGSGCEHCGEC